MFRKTLICFATTLFMFPLMVFGYSPYIYAGGENIGIDVKSKGVIIVGSYKVDNEDVISSSDLRVGDIIVSIDSNKITNISDLTKIVSNITKNEIKVGYKRNNVLDYTTLRLKKVNNEYKTGLYVKDSVVGIGTLTFVDPETKIFGALGHEIIEKNSGMILDIDSGTIFHSEVLGIEPSNVGIPGEKRAKYYSNMVIGSIFENTNKGIFGNYSYDINKNKLYKVANINDIKKGDAKIRTVVSGTTVKEYNIKITDINTKGKTKNIVFEITDQELLNLAGGIVQGMSGSPIIQGEYIVGAVTHVVIENPRKGYGIFIVNMLEEAEN